MNGSGKKLVLTSKQGPSTKPQPAGNILGNFKSLKETAKEQGEKVTRSTWADRTTGDSVTRMTGGAYNAVHERPAPIPFKDIVQETAGSDYQQSQRLPAHPTRAMGLVYGNRAAPANQSNYSTFASHKRASDSKQS